MCLISVIYRPAKPARPILVRPVYKFSAQYMRSAEGTSATEVTKELLSDNRGFTS